MSGSQSRSLEEVAVGIVCRWLGDRGLVTHTGRGHGPDFRIDYADGRRAVGEVGWHVDEALAEMWAVTLSQPEHHVVRLQPGRGLWSLGLLPGAHVKRLIKDVPDLIEELRRSGVRSLHPATEWPLSDLSRRAEELGIERVDLVTTDVAEGDDRAIYLFGSRGAFLPDNPDVIVDWLERLLFDARFDDTSRKLLPLEADERHVFLIAGSAAPPEVCLLMMDLRDRTPRRAPRLPDGITHAWVVGEWGRGDSAVWCRETGWQLVVAPTLDG